MAAALAALALAGCGPTAAQREARRQAAAQAARSKRARCDRDTATFWGYQHAARLLSAQRGAAEQQLRSAAASDDVRAVVSAQTALATEIAGQPRISDAMSADAAKYMKRADREQQMARSAAALAANDPQDSGSTDYPPDYVWWFDSCQDARLDPDGTARDADVIKDGLMNLYPGGYAFPGEPELRRTLTRVYGPPIQ